jgi:hypothetical protein
VLVSKPKAGKKAHPKIKGHPDLTRFGCTPCHGGQGRRLDDQAHGPPVGGGPDPFLPRSLRQARCSRCHVPGFPSAPDLKRGFNQYLTAACSGCHQPGRWEEGLGPDLRHRGRRSPKELLTAILEPRKGQPQALMWSLAWRYNQKTKAGRAALQDLLLCLLSLSDDPRPYRSAWANRGIRVANLSCTRCHHSQQRASGQPHRCALLKGNDSLRCLGCHNTLKPTPTNKECPQIKAARPQCPICH